jgi:serine-type D-Ala-D-Ala endopeptidase (penicillin-binding protein 7)
MTFLAILFLFLVNQFFWKGDEVIQNTNLYKLANLSLETKENSGKYLELEENLSAKAYLVREKSGKVLLSQNSSESFPIASIAKIFSAYVALKYVPENEIITLSKKAVSQEGIAGLFQPGEKFLRNELIKAALILSSNDAIYALAESYGLENFMFLLNRTIQNFNLKKTHLVEPTGLSPGNVSSPEDILNFVFALRGEFPQIWSWSKEEEIFLDGFRKRKFNNVNIVTIKKYEKELMMQKTGFTEEAGKCLVTVIKLENSPEEIGIVLLNAPQREKDLDLIIKALKKYYERNSSSNI